MGSGALTKSMVVIFLTSLAVSSCQFAEEEVRGQEEQVSYQGEPTVLGRKLENPFSIANMSRAYDSLVSSGSIARLPQFQIEATHYYVRIKISGDSELDKLIADTSLFIFDHPLDYEVLSAGEHYRSDDEHQYLYASLPIGKILPAATQFEVLEKLYLPSSDRNLEESAARIGRTSADVVTSLEDMSYQLTGNNSEIETTTSTSRASLWTPAGRVTVWDNRVNRFIPVKGVKVLARRWFDVKVAYTDDQGYYRMNGGFRHSATYVLKWETKRFDVRSGSFGQARLDGPTKKGDWNVEIKRGGISFHYAHVFRAAFRYNHGDIGGLKRPGFRLKYSVFNKRGNHLARNIGNWSAFGINPNILIYRFSSRDGTENDADEMFSTTCHETAHTTHMEAMRAGAVQFMQVSELIRESWAIGVEWFITQLEYKDLGVANYGEATYGVQATFPITYGFQYWSKSRSESLTSLFIDIVDKNNQRGQRFGRYRSGVVEDPVYGFDFAGIERDILPKTYGLSSLSDQLKSHCPEQISSNNVDVLLEYF